MTVQELIEDLNYRISSGEIYPDTPVVREWGQWNRDGSGNHKEIMFSTVKFLIKTKPTVSAELGLEVVDHPVYRRATIGEPVRLVVLD